MFIFCLGALLHEGKSVVCLLFTLGAAQRKFSSNVSQLLWALQENSQKSIQLDFANLKDAAVQRRWIWGHQHLILSFSAFKLKIEGEAVTKEGLMLKLRLITLSTWWGHSYHNKSFRNCDSWTIPKIMKDGSEVTHSLSLWLHLSGTWPNIQLLIFIYFFFLRLIFGLNVKDIRDMEDFITAYPRMGLHLVLTDITLLKP